MKKIIIATAIATLPLYAGAFGLPKKMEAPKVEKPSVGEAVQIHGMFVNPNTVKGDGVPEAVEAYINKNASFLNSAAGGDAAALKAMVIAEKTAFLGLSKAENKEAVEKVVKSSCVVGVCNYTLLLTAYNKEVGAK